MDQSSPSVIKSTSQILIAAIDGLFNSTVSDDVLKSSLNSIQDTVDDQMKWISNQNASLVEDDSAAQVVVGTIVEAIRLTTSVKDSDVRTISKNFQTNLNVAVIKLSDGKLLGENATTIVARIFKLDIARTEFRSDQPIVRQQHGLVLEHSKPVDDFSKHEIKSGIVTYFFDPKSHLQQLEDENTSKENHNVVEMIIDNISTERGLNRVHVLLPVTADSYTHSHSIFLPQPCDADSAVTPCGTVLADITFDFSSMGAGTTGEICVICVKYCIFRSIFSF